MSAKVEIRGTSQTKAAITKAILEGTKGMGDAVKLSAMDIRNDLIKTVNNGSRTGVKYIRGGKQAQRSAPGEPPKADSGRLASSFDMKMTAKTEAIAGVLKGSPIVAKYAKWLEFGTSRIAARPFMIPAMERARRKFFDRVVKAVKDLGKGVA